MTTRPTTQHDIQRDDENINRPGYSVVTNLVVSGNLSMLYSGIDPGTGQVTLFVTGTPSLPILDNSLFKVSGTFLSFDNGIFVSVTGSYAYIFISGSGVTNGDAHDHVGGDGAPITIPLQFGAHGQNAGITASTTNWTCPGRDGLLALESAMLITVAGTLKNLYIRTATPQPASGTLVCTLRVNNADTALVVTIAAGAAAGNYSDTTHTVALSVADRIGWKIVNNATAASAGVGSTVVELDVANV